jgi:hypothetical protein
MRCRAHWLVIAYFSFFLKGQLAYRKGPVRLPFSVAPLSKHRVRSSSFTTGSQNGYVDISPSRDGGILKKILQRGDPEMGTPKVNDVVELRWTIMNEGGSLISSSNSALNKTFLHIVGLKPCPVIPAWDIAIQTMHCEELASLIIEPAYAFGEKGADGFVPPGSTIKCEIELLNFAADFRRKYSKIGENEDITEELSGKIRSGSSPVSDHVMQSRIMTEHKSASGPGNEPLMFDPLRHAEDLNQKVTGKAESYSWRETKTNIDITVPLRAGTKKSDISVEMRCAQCESKLILTMLS